MLLTSLIPVEERLREAAWWCRPIARQTNSERLGYHLNAFLSAARSVTFLLQKEMARVPGFEAWWRARREELKADHAARFFLELRNFSQKEGRVSVVGGSYATSRGAAWSWCFAGNAEPVPDQLRHRHIADCCEQHAGKLATLILRFADVFPFHACPAQALTVEGVSTLGLALDDVDAALGFPPGYTDCGERYQAERIELLGRQVDRVDFQTIRRIARWADRGDRRPVDGFLCALVDRFERRRDEPGHGDPILQVLGERILEAESDRNRQ